MQRSSEAPPGLRETKKLATRKALSSAARRLGVANRLDSVTFEMICAEVGVSVRTFFNFFESKEGPTGNLLTDLMVLLDPTQAIEDEGRDEITMAFKMIQSDPEVPALQLSRVIEHERVLAELIAARRGLPSNRSACTTMAAVAQTILRRGGLDWFQLLRGRPGSGVPIPVARHRDRPRAGLLAFRDPVVGRRRHGGKGRGRERGGPDRRPHSARPGDGRHQRQHPEDAGRRRVGARQRCVPVGRPARRIGVEGHRDQPTR